MSSHYTFVFLSSYLCCLFDEGRVTFSRFEGVCLLLGPCRRGILVVDHPRTGEVESGLKGGSGRTGLIPVEMLIIFFRA